MTLDYFFIHFLLKFSWKLWNLRFNNFEDNLLHSQNDGSDIYGSPKNFLFNIGNAYIF